MQKILDRGFVAVNLKGESYTIGDIAQLMEDHGLYQFNKIFGFDHGKVTFIPSSCYFDYYHYTDAQFLKRIWTASKRESEFKYVITDGFGRQYSPAYLFEQLSLEQPKRARRIIDKYISKYYGRSGFKNCKNWYLKNRGFYKHPSNIKLFKQDAMLSEFDVKGIRKLKHYYDCIWDDGSLRHKQKNWKKQRKNQYK